MNKKIVVIDFSEVPTHADSLYSQFQFLDGYEIHGFFHESYKGFVPNYPNVKSLRYYSKEKGICADISVVAQAVRLIRQHQPRVILLNTGQGNRVRLLALRLFFDDTPLVGLHHNPQKLLESFSQKIISQKVRKYLVMADFIKESIVNKIPHGVAVESFYPIFFESPSVLEKKIEEEQADDIIRIGVLGALDQSRRDYEGLYEALWALGDKIPSNLRFCFLGDSSKPQARAIREKLASLPCRSQMEFSEGFLSFEELFSRVQKVDLVMPLLHPALVYFDEYKDYKITGAYLLGLCYRKPFFFEKSLRHMSDFSDYSLYYDVSSLSSALLSLSASKDELNILKKRLLEAENLKFTFQKNKYLKFLGL